MDCLKCPITCEIFTDPVTAQDGHTYERNAITNWLKRNPTSPITREPMTVSSLRPNYIVKKMLEEFQSSTIKKHYHFELNIDIRKTKSRPLFRAPGKTIYEAEWISRAGPSIILLTIDGAKARREAEFYVQLGCHPHIVRTYGMLESEPNTLTLVQEFASQGDLSQLLREKRFRPSTAVLLEIFIQIADAMVCLADNNIVHGDLACRNVLVFRMDNCDPKCNQVKLTDFGLTRASTLYTVADSSASATMIIIPVRYAAPEILRNDNISNYTEKSDVYSMGVLMWEACSSGQIPYASIDNDEDVRRLKLQGAMLGQPNNCDPSLSNIITSCWQQQPDSRPNFKTLKQSLLHLQFQQRHHPMNTANSEQICATDSAITSSHNVKQKESMTPTTFLSSHSNFKNNLQKPNTIKHSSDKLKSSDQSKPHFHRNQNETDDDEEDDDEEPMFHQQSYYDDDNDTDDDNEEIEPMFHQQPQYRGDDNTDDDDDDEEVEPVFHQQLQYYNDDNHDDDDDEEVEAMFHQPPQYCDDDNDDDDDEIEAEFHQPPQYCDDDCDDHDDNDDDDDEIEAEFHQPPQHCDDDSDDHEDDDSDDDDEEVELAFNQQPQHCDDDSDDHEDDDDDNDDVEIELVFYQQPQYYDDDSDDDDDDDDDD